MEIYLIRHPRPTGIDGLCYGRLDVSVDQTTIAAAADSIVNQIPDDTLKTASIYCSPLSRCVALARRLAAPNEPLASDDLIEMNFGQWQGLRWDAIPRDQIDAWATEVWDYCPGGGESAQMVAIRWQRWVDALRQKRERGVIAVTHAGVIRVALARSGYEMGAPAVESHIPFGSVYRLDIA
ncbi:MAG: alpha-ribazole phosphatase [Gammaproteobacteria bacterium]|nr:alpha-ribazole phosphatase [Gammaproteobacteria bacterium]